MKNYAVLESKLHGRLHLEKDSDYLFRKSEFAIDRQRIIDSSAFRRLQYKTQVFVNHQGDHFRTRLTHSLEVAQIARRIAFALDLNQDLAEIIALAHDLGHPPFGHAGEEALNNEMQNFGGFSHNVFGLKILTKIEKKFLDFAGLNLSWEVLEGFVKHNGAIDVADKKDSKNDFLTEFNKRFDLQLKSNPSLEAQIAAISDDIAYNNHDIEDGLRAELFEVEDLFELPLIGEIYQKIIKENGKIKREMLVAHAKREISSAMICDLILKTKHNLEEKNIQSIADVRSQTHFIVEFSSEMNNINLSIKRFLLEKMYRHPLINRMAARGKKIVSELFYFYVKNPTCLPLEISSGLQYNLLPEALELIVCDYIAGMTDRFAIKEFEDLILK